MVDDYIASLAILKVNWDNRDDYIENFVPFAAECIRLLPQKYISLSRLQSDMKKRFGFSIPQEALKTILSRAIRRGYATKKGRRYLKVSKGLSSIKFSQHRDDALRQTRALVDKLRAFLEQEHSLEVSSQEAENELLHYVRHHSELALRTETNSPFIRRGGSDQAAYKKYLIESFILDLSEGDPEGFRYLETVVLGSILANTLFFPSLGQVPEKLHSVRIYLDTSLLLGALGVTGESLSTPYREMISLAREIGASLCCFEETLEETLRVLRFVETALMTNFDYDGHNDILEHCLTHGVTASDIELLIGKIDSLLRDLKIHVRKAPKMTRQLSVNERRLQDLLSSGRFHRSEQAVIHDVQALAAIHRLRGGTRHTRIETCKATFVTTSRWLAYISSKFFKEHFQNTTAPHCMDAQAFTTMVWLKKPQSAPDLPMKMLIANCYAAMNPSNELWDRFLNEVSTLRSRGDISTDDYHYFRFSLPAKNALLKITKGGTTDLQSEDIPRILEQAKEVSREEVRRELLASQTQIQADLQEKEADIRRIQRESSTEIQALKQRAIDAEDRAQRAEDTIHELDKAQDVLATLAGNRTAGIFSLIIKTSGLTLAGSIIILSIPDILKGVTDSWIDFAAPLAALAALLSSIFTLINWGFGTSISSLAARAEVTLARKVRAIVLTYLRKNAKHSKTEQDFTE